MGIDSKGAELKTVFHLHHRIEYLWQADSAFWAKTSPVLFPVVGALKENTFRHKGKTYSLPRHGFARDMPFEVADQQDNTITFVLKSNAETEKVYPFQFSFFIIYSVIEDALSVTYRIVNRGEEEMFFSVGGHPAFKVPLVDETSYEDYGLLFAKNETADRWPIAGGGLIDTTPQPLLVQTNSLPLSKELFQKDAIVLKQLQSEEIELVSDATPHGLRFSFDGFPYLGLWAAPGANFLCIEPWCGIADSVGTSGELKEKEGINHLAPGKKFSVTWNVQFF